MNSIEAIRRRYLEFMQWDDKSMELKIVQIAGEYAYYQSLYYETSKKMTIAQKEHDDMWQGKYKQYKFDFDIQLSHTEIKTFLDKDNDLLAKLVEVKKLRDFANFLEEAMKNINQLRWDIKNYIEWKKFQKGM